MLKTGTQLGRVPKSPPVVPGVTAGERPLWSVMIPVFNCGKFLPATLQSVLVQDPGLEKMQIEVIDDGSTDLNVLDIVQQIGGGRISYYRQHINVGSLRNFQTCLERSRGHLVHLLHGDDLVRQGFYSNMEVLFSRMPALGAAFSRYGYVDRDGRFMYAQPAEQHTDGLLDNWLQRIGERQLIQYAAMVVKREVYERLGGFYGAEYGEDWEMWVRIAAHYPVGYLPDILADYRKHSESISGRAFVTAANMRDLEWAMTSIQQYLPAERRAGILKKSRRFYSHYAMRIAKAMWIDHRNSGGAAAQMRAAWRMSRDPILALEILKLSARITLSI